MVSRESARIENERRFGATSIVLADYGGVSEQHDHAHDYATLSFVLSGTVIERTGRRERRAGPGSLIVKPRDLVHADAFQGARARLLSLRVAAGSGPFEHYYHGLRAYRLRRDCSVAAGFFGLEDALERGAGTRTVARRLRAIDVALGDPSWSSPETTWCENLAATIEADPFVSTTVLAANRGVHPVYLARIFRRRFAISPMAFARRVRLERAAAAIADGAEITRAAAEHGFADQSHLTRCFSRELGTTPARYRRLADS